MIFTQKAPAQYPSVFFLCNFGTRFPFPGHFVPGKVERILIRMSRFLAIPDDSRLPALVFPKNACRLSGVPLGEALTQPIPCQTHKRHNFRHRSPPFLISYCSIGTSYPLSRELFRPTLPRLLPPRFHPRIVPALFPYGPVASFPTPFCSLPPISLLFPLWLLLASSLEPASQILLPLVPFGLRFSPFPLVMGVCFFPQVVNSPHPDEPDPPSRYSVPSALPPPPVSLRFRFSRTIRPSLRLQPVRQI